jgi:hypothetical protein
MISQYTLNEVSSGKTIQFRPVGNSMTPLIKSGQLVTVSPDRSDLKIGDVVLCRVKGRILLHLLSAVNGTRFQISNNHGKINGYASHIYGKVIKVED